MYLMNTSIIPNAGMFKVEVIGHDEAQSRTEDEEIVSAIGHQSTMMMVNELLGTQFEANRVEVVFAKGDKALVFKLKARPPEGKTLNKEELESIGWYWMLIERLD